MNQEVELLKELTQKTNSELILFFVIVIVGLIAIVPLYKMMSSDRKDRIKAESESANLRQDKYMEREKEIIKVITAYTEDTVKSLSANNEVMVKALTSNTEVMAGLKVTLETSGAATNAMLVRVDTKVDDIVAGINQLLLLTSSNVPKGGVCIEKEE